MVKKLTRIKKSENKSRPTLPHLPLDGAENSYLLAKGVEEVGQVQVGELTIEALQNQVQTGDHITAELQRQGSLDGAAAALQRRVVHS